MYKLVKKTGADSTYLVSVSLSLYSAKEKDTPPVWFSSKGLCETKTKSVIPLQLHPQSHFRVFGAQSDEKLAVAFTEFQAPDSVFRSRQPSLPALRGSKLVPNLSGKDEGSCSSTRHQKSVYRPNTRTLFSITQ